MKYRTNLMTGLIGLALLVTPIAAAAKDKDSGQNNSRQSQAQSHNNASESRSYTAPERSNRPARNDAPAAMSRQESREQHISRSYNMPPVEAGRHESRDQNESRTFNTAPVVTDRRDWHQQRHEDRNDRNQWNREASHQYRRGYNDWRSNDERRDYASRDRDYRHYGDRGYGRYGEAPYYAMPRGYAGGSPAFSFCFLYFEYQASMSGDIDMMSSRRLLSTISDFAFVIHIGCDFG